MAEQTQDYKTEFLKTDGRKTKSNAIEVPFISLPQGGGAIRGIDEKFSVNAINGTSSFSIPLPFSPARGVSPSLSLTYNSGAGNGVFGLGWNLNLGSIKRKSDKGLPQYLDPIDSDTFLFSEAEDLVPEFKTDKQTDGTILFAVDDHNDYVINERDSTDGQFIIRNYKPRIEGLFARIERWTSKNSEEKKWRVTNRNNLTTLYGWTIDARLADPADDFRIYEWLPEFVFDDKGNCIQYIYKKEDGIGVDESLLHNRNRLKNGLITYSNLYPEKVLYGNKTPYNNFGEAFPPAADYLFSTVFDYGEYDKNSPYDKVNNWNLRQDAFSDYRSGFEIRTTRLCQRVLLFHHFTGLNEYEGLIRSINFDYDNPSEQDFTFLKTISSYGYIKKADGTYVHQKLPPIEFKYQRHEWNAQVKTITSDALIHAPAGLDEQGYQFLDLFNEGLSGILTEQANGWYYKHNLGEGRFEHAKLVSPKPSFAGLGVAMQLADLDADGGKQLVSYEAEPKGFFEIDEGEEWQTFSSFKAFPNIDLSDPNTRMLDLNGDGKPEVVISEDQVFTWYASEGREGYAASKKTEKPFNEEAGPNIVFADITQSIFLADMSGDGMTDILRIRNGEICYWPNLGYGKFGSKVAMDHAPVFDHPDSFNPAYLRLADIDGSGTTDIIYLGKNKFTCWKNLSGNTFGVIPFEIDPFPEVHSRSQITLTDLLGNGVACIVWSSALLKDSCAPLKYIDLMNSKKPHIMVSYQNNLGKEVSLEYTPSTKFYIDDKLAGKPWATRLHFPVHCISKTITVDKISGYKFVSEYRYHHGYYDHPEREFRGFGMVEQTDAETFEHWKIGDASNIVEAALHQEPVISKTWYHTGAFLQKDKILTQFAKDYWYEEMQRHGFAVNHHESDLPEARLVGAPGIDPSILDHLSAQEWQEALRACKGIGLRSEIFAKDAVQNGNTDEAFKKELTPFTVATHNCLIELLQPKGKNKHAVFAVKESEAMTYSYERDPEDPRIAHSLNIKLDEFGNVLESASVVYTRLTSDTSLPPETQQEQDQTVITYTQTQFTNDVISDEAYYLRLPSEVKAFELKGITKGNTFYEPGDFTDILSDAKSDTAFYHETDKPLLGGKAQKRLTEHVRSTYYRNTLTGALPLHRLESPAVPFENYQLAYTPELVTDIFGAKVNAALLTEGKFTNSENDNNWWIRSGTAQFLKSGETAADAKGRFYAPVSYTDPYGALTRVKYYGTYFLFIEETEDARGNKPEVVSFNFRTLSPKRMKDINGNFSEAISDELGFVKALAVMGKGAQADDLSGFEEITENEQGDIAAFFQTANSAGVCDSADLHASAKKLLKNASTRFIYDFNTYLNTGKPAVVSSITRETHYRKEDGNLNAESRLQTGFEYSNGLGQVIMGKQQAGPGIAYFSDGLGNRIESDTTPFLRWLGNGRTILNNKGNPVKQYEPFFSITPKFEDDDELVTTGVTTVMYYDAMSRLIKSEMPDDTFSKVVFDSWKQMVYDASDTVLEPGNKWYSARMNDSLGNKEKLAAQKASKHADTPGILHFNTLGRPVLSIAHNRNIVTEADEFYYTKVHSDTEGNLRQVTDARNNVVMQYKYDMLGNLVYQNSMDAGQRWLLINILGNPLRTWDERSHEFQYSYDILHRPIESKVLGGDGDIQLNHVFDRIFYGEEESDAELRNLRGQVLKYYDTGGFVETPEYDFKGQAKSTSRRLFKDYRSVANWIDANLTTDLENDAFTFITEADALGRIIKQTAPDGSIIVPSYNEAGLLNGETLTHANPVITTIYIKDIDYNEKGQRNKIIYGNDVTTRFHYDEKTFGLKQLVSRQQNSEVLQDLHYTYDPVGNITAIEDKAIPVSFFDNSIIEPLSEYTYDALYQLVRASGRENNAALTLDSKDNWNDTSYIHKVSPGDPMAVRNYVQTYQYDETGNIREMKHVAAGNSWTRGYEYETINNRLKNTKVGQGTNSFTYLYPHHAQHGFITVMPHLEDMAWNFKEELVKTIRQKVNPGNGTAETTYYQYDGGGQRIRKITENKASSGITPAKKEERIYIAGYELYRKHSSPFAGLERVSLSLMDGGHRFVMIEIRNGIDDDTEERLVRYQLHNHLDSSCLELDDTAQIISYEEYHPYGSTAYQAANSTIKAAAKRYRYTGMERDEETGLEYHSARYYLPWLGRWLSADPIGIAGGMNLYEYCKNNTLLYSDIDGEEPKVPGHDKDLGNIADKFVGMAMAAIIQQKNPATITKTQVYTKAGGTKKNMDPFFNLKNKGKIDLTAIENGTARIWEIKPDTPENISKALAEVRHYQKLFPDTVDGIKINKVILGEKLNPIRLEFSVLGHTITAATRSPHEGVIVYSWGIKSKKQQKSPALEKETAPAGEYKWAPEQYSILPAEDWDNIANSKPLSPEGRLIYPWYNEMGEIAEKNRRNELTNEADLLIERSRIMEERNFMAMEKLRLSACTDGQCPPSAEGSSRALKAAGATIGSVGIGYLIWKATKTVAGCAIGGPPGCVVGAVTP